MCDHAFRDVPLPSGWAKDVRSAVLHVISLAHYAIVTARGWAANSINARVRLAAENDQLKQGVELLREEIRLKDARTARVPPRHRPPYRPTERMAILELKAARSWTSAETARRFQVEPVTGASWLICAAPAAWGLEPRTLVAHRQCQLSHPSRPPPGQLPPGRSLVGYSPQRSPQLPNSLCTKVAGPRHHWHTPTKPARMSRNHDTGYSRLRKDGRAHFPQPAGSYRISQTFTGWTLPLPLPKSITITSSSASYRRAWMTVPWGSARSLRQRFPPARSQS